MLCESPFLVNLASNVTPREKNKTCATFVLLNKVVIIKMKSTSTFFVLGETFAVKIMQKIAFGNMGRPK